MDWFDRTECVLFRWRERYGLAIQVILGAICAIILGAAIGKIIGWILFVWQT
jgi:hypothetical protein